MCRGMSTSTATSFAGSFHGPASPALPAAIGADTGAVAVRGVGTLGYYRDLTGDDPPVVLLHSVNAAASSYEMRPLFESLRGRRRVFALDLPGFGRSERGARAYNPALYADAIERFVVDVASPQGHPVDLVALSLSSEFAARAALRSPSLFRSLTLLSPTGLGPPRSRATPLLRGALGVAPLAAGLFRLLRAEGSVRYFLSKSFVGRPDEGLVRYALRTAAAPGAHHAPVAFVRGDLFTADAFDSLYAPLRVPTRVVYDRDAYSSFERLDALTRANPAVTAHRLAPTRGMPQFERPSEVVDLIERPVARGGRAP